MLHAWQIALQEPAKLLRELDRVFVPFYVIALLACDLNISAFVCSASRQRDNVINVIAATKLLVAISATIFLRFPFGIEIFLRILRS